MENSLIQSQNPMKNITQTFLYQIFVQFRPAVFILLLFTNLVFAAGTLDSNFGSGGKVSFQFGGTGFAASAVLQSDGKIVIVGATSLNAQPGGAYNFAVARLNTDGTLDTTFGNGGLVATDITPSAEDNALSVFIQPDGKIVTGGYSGSFMALVRYNANGTLDNKFGNGGKIITDIEESDEEKIKYLLPQADGKILAVGTIFFARQQIIAVRYNTDGTLDSTFGNSGKFKISLSPTLTSLGGAAIQPDGKILISGVYEFVRAGCVPTNTDSCRSQQGFLMRFNEQMTLDRKFGRSFGKEFDVRNRAYIFLDLALQTDGRILVSTNSQVPWRYSSIGRLDNIFDYPGVAYRNSNSFKFAERADGKIVGCASPETNNFIHDFGVVLYNNDGHLIGSDQRDFFGDDDGCIKIFVQPDNKILLVGSAKSPQGGYRFAALRYLDITP
jgi:uncharacterized delta-60 repeat protein